MNSNVLRLLIACTPPSRLLIACTAPRRRADRFRVPTSVDATDSPKQR
jgi:hypothetical protein